MIFFFLYQSSYQTTTAINNNIAAIITDILAYMSEDNYNTKHQYRSVKNVPHIRTKCKGSKTFIPGH